MKAVLVVDIQSSFWHRKSYECYEAAKREVEKSVGDFLGWIRERTSIPVVFVMYRRPSPSVEAARRIRIPAQTSLTPTCLGCNSKDDFLPDFLQHNHEKFEPIFFKDDNNAFTNKTLAEHLRKRGVNELFILGCYTFNCILNTTVGAIRKGFGITLLRDCIYYPFRDGEEDFWLKSVKSRTRLILIGNHLHGSVKIESSRNMP